MMKIFALLGLFTFAAAPLWAAEETHIYEFDYDNQIEAPVLSQPSADSAVPLEAGQSIIIPPPPASGEPAFTPPPPVKTAEPAPEEPLDALFMPAEANQPAPEKTAAAPESEAAKAPAAEEKINITRAPAKTAAAPKARPAAKAAPKKAEAAFIRDPRFRLWLLASLAWNAPRSGGYYYGGAESVYRRQPIDLKNFPSAASLPLS